MVCPLCKKENSVLCYGHIRHDTNYKLVACDNCNLFYLNPFPTKMKIKSFYGSKYYYDNPVNDGVFATKSLLFFNSIKKYLPSGGCSLDVGCSKGFLSYFFKKHNFDAYGIDLSSKACSFARKIGVNAIASDLLNYNPNKKFDVITIIDLIEHVDEPQKVLKKANSLLKKGGLLIVSTPNIKSFYSKISKSNWAGFDLPFHIIYFSKDSLSFGLKNAGFKSNNFLTDSFNLISIEGLLRTNLNVYFGKLLEFFGLRTKFRQNFMLPKIKIVSKQKNIILGVKITIVDKLKMLINYPLNVIFNGLLLGDSLISISRK